MNPDCSSLHVCWCVVNTVLCYMFSQIAAKIGGEGAPPVSNNGGAESPFISKKRSLEGGGESSTEGRLVVICLYCDTETLFL